MTLLFSVFDPIATIIAADQQITLRGNNKVWDSQSSKLVLVFCRDGMAAIGYTGLAYINREPTDEFIARHIAEILKPGVFKNEGMLIGGRRRPIKLATTLKSMIDALHDSVRHHAIPFSLVIAGQRQFKGRIYPFIAQLDHLQQRISYPEMRKSSIAKRDYAVGGDTGNPIELLACYTWNFQRLFIDAPPLHSIDHRLRAIINTYKWRRQASRTIGGSIHFAIIGLGFVNVGMYEGDDWQTPGVRMDGLVDEHAVSAFGSMKPTTYTPWLVSDTFLAAPQVGTGSAEMSSWYWRIKMEQLYERTPEPPSEGSKYRLTGVVLPDRSISGWGTARRRSAP